MFRRGWYNVVYSQNYVFRGGEKEHEGEDFYAKVGTKFCVGANVPAL